MQRAIHSTEKLRTAPVALLLFLLPITMGTVASAASAIFILLFALALTQPFRNWKPTETYEWILLFLVVGFFAAVLLSFINAGDMHMSVSRLERILRVLGLVPVYFLLKNRTALLAKYFFYGIVAAGPVMLAVAVFGKSLGGRAEGAYNSILFGNYATIIAVVSFTLMFFSSKSKWFRLAGLISFICAAQAAILSGTRGAYLSIPIAAAVVATLFVIIHARSKKQVLLQLVTLFSAGVVAAGLAMSNPTLKPRLDAAQSEIVQYFSGENTQTSIGLRFQMWEASVRMWLKNPVIGSGLGDFSADFQEQIRTGESKAAHHFGEAHSLYFEFLGTTGTLGIALLMLSMFLFPSYLFFKSLRGTKELTLVSVSALVFILAFMVFAISQNWLGRSSITSVYFTGLALFLAERFKLQRPISNDQTDQ